MFSIKAVSEATGLSVETLRAWERRYGVVVPDRDGSGRRVYRPDDVLRLRRLREATERGHPIGRLSQLADTELAELLEAPAESRSSAAAEALVQRMLDAAERYRAADCEQTLTLAIALMPTERLCSEFLRPLLTEVGERWHRGKFSIAQERLVSGTVRKHLGVVLDAYDRNSRGPGIAFATLQGERHELGLLMSAVTCASRGYKCHFLGTDLPATEIARYAREVGTDIVAISVVLEDQLATLPLRLSELATELGPGHGIWLGGAALNGWQNPRLPAPCVIIRDQADLERRLDLLAA